VDRGGPIPGDGARWTSAIFSRKGLPRPGPGLGTIGILRGEGIGPEVIDAALLLLAPIEEAFGERFDIRFGGAIGRDAELLTGRCLTDEVTAFCEEVFSRGGAILAGPGGGRFVYDLRRRFDLFCKISPLRPSAALAGAGRLTSAAREGVDILVVRENVGGVYAGETRETVEPGEGRVCEHTFRYTEREVRRILDVAAALAAARRGDLTVVVKDGGMPEMTCLWRDVAAAAAARSGVRVGFVNVDLAAYLLVQEPRRFDVVVAGNLFGDVLADAGAVLIGSRGLAYSGNFSASGAAVYQTNHGGASDIAGTGRANPLGQVASLVMLLRESLGLEREAEWIERGVARVLARGWRTFDIAENGARIVGTREMGEGVASAMRELALARAG
jgi:3-isopropylmalate dehydrogenase